MILRPVQDRAYSLMHHALLSAYGNRRKEVYLAVFTAFIDDSGTDPKQLVAIASALIIPAKRIPTLDREWKTFLHKEGLSETEGFHTSECAAHNPKSEFASWDDIRVGRVFSRIRQVIRKHAVQAYSISINKEVYEAVIPAELRRVVGNTHYTWGVDAICGFIRDWAMERGVPIELVFDNTGKSQKKEIERALEHGEELHPGLCVGHYSFQNRREIPALQCADMFAWTCYQRSLSYLHGKPIRPLAEESWQQFSSWKNGEEDWAGTWFTPKEQLKEWVRRVYADPVELGRIRKLK